MYFAFEIAPNTIAFLNSALSGIFSVTIFVSGIFCITTVVKAVIGRGKCR